ncbi:MAG TPA: hypothetical protein VMC09_09455, partial [Anaerolineales bacterium]|nr:hypothetical protein [Anaerolineales bacterium]
MDSQNNTLTIREYPVFETLIGLGLLATAVFTGLAAKGDWTITLITGLIGLLFLGLAATLVVQADRIAGTLTIQRSSLLRRFAREIPVSDIAAIQLETSRSSSNSSSTYRIIAITKQGETIPFRSSFSSGFSTKEAKARKLREFLGVGGQDLSLGGLFETATSMAQQAFQEKQEALTGPEAEEHTTEGVHWRVQTAAFGGMGITRWFSPDQTCPTGFVFLAQKVAGQGSAGGLFGGLNKMLYHQLLGMYGYGQDDALGLEYADILPDVDPKLDPHFTVFTSDPSAARQFLNPWSVAPLADWATRYPLKQVQKTN